MTLTRELLTLLNGEDDPKQKCTLLPPKLEFDSVAELAEQQRRAAVEEARLNCLAGLRDGSLDKRVEVSGSSNVDASGVLTLSGQVTKYPDSKAAFNGYIVVVRALSDRKKLGFGMCNSATKQRVLVTGLPSADTVRAAMAADGVMVVPLHRLMYEEDTLDVLSAFAQITESLAVPYILRPSLTPERSSPAVPLGSQFNQEQCDAVALVQRIASEPGGIAVIQGPPGTGKSHVIARGLLALPELGRTLVVCNSNNGLDSVLGKLREAFDDAETWACRIGCEDRVSASVSRSFYKGDVSTDVSAYRVVFTTIYQAGRTKGAKVDGVAAPLPDWTFETVIFEEASQTRETDVVKVALRNQRTLRRLVLVGDQEQLPPIANDEMKLSGYGGSFMQRVLDARASHASHVMLKEQHRMAPTICALVSRLSYKGALRCGPSVRGPDPGALHGKALLGINLKSPLLEEDVFVPSSRSYFNSAEVDAVGAVWEWLARHGEALGLGVLDRMFEQCAVITNHVEQKARLQSLIVGVPREQLSSPGRSGGGSFDAETLAKVQAIDTVDTYQGSEREVIVLSPLSTKRTADRCLLNVALSRAKRLVVVVGAFEQLAKDRPELWGAVSEHLHTSGTVLHVAQPDMADLRGQLQELLGAASAAPFAEGEAITTQATQQERRVRQRTDA